MTFPFSEGALEALRKLSNLSRSPQIVRGGSGPPLSQILKATPSPSPLVVMTPARGGCWLVQGTVTRQDSDFPQKTSHSIILPNHKYSLSINHIQELCHQAQSHSPWEAHRPAGSQMHGNKAQCEHGGVDSQVDCGRIQAGFTEEQPGSWDLADT